MPAIQPKDRKSLVKDRLVWKPGQVTITKKGAAK
jgi:hypothetical protein